MAKYVTVAYGLVTRAENSLEGLPPVTMSGDPWIKVDGLIPTPIVGDHTPDEGVTFVNDRTSLSAAQGAKCAELRDACAYHIKMKGFQAAGILAGETEVISLVYPCQPNDQMNLHQVISASQASPSETFPIRCGIPGTGGPWVQDTDPASWMMREHTATFISDVAHNLNQHITNAREFLEYPGTESPGFVNQVLAATTVSAVNAIAWEGPSN